VKPETDPRGAGGAIEVIERRNLPATSGRGKHRL